MDNTFQWRESYSVKVTALDNQHKQLFAIIRELYTAMQSGRGSDVAGDVLQRLIDYTVNHFATEEKLMEKHGYPHLASHRVEHRALTDQVVAFKKNFDAGTSNVSQELLAFLQHWLRDHIQAVDQKYSDFLNSHGVH